MADTKRPEKKSKVDDILNVAERMARTGGYNSFSFREIADEVGIKSASVHYHFPAKDDLGVALARRYTDRFLGALGDADDPDRTPSELLSGYVDLYRTAVLEEGLMCLCGMFGAEVEELPETVAEETKDFFKRNIAWLTEVYQRKDTTNDADACRTRALKLISTLEGAMIVARTLGDTGAFEAVATNLESSFVLV